jgi:putative peptide zinc metalloprotease protein
MTRTRMTRLLAAALAAATFGGAAAATVHAQDSAAVAVNTRDDSTIFRLVFDIRRVMGDVVDETNAAVAYASCESCQTVAISIQALLVFSDPSVVTPTNLALATNYDCTLCQTLASAYQFVFGTAGPVRFTAEGNQKIAEIRQELEALRTSGLSIDEIQVKADALADELRQVLATEVVAVGPDEAASAGAGTQPPLEQPTETTPVETTPTTTTETTETTTTPPTTETTPATTETTTTPSP